MNGLNIDINELRNDKDRYEIPFFIAEFFRTLLKKNSNKNSHISNLKAKNYSKISYNDTKILIDEIICNLNIRLNKENAPKELYWQVKQVENEWKRNLERARIINKKSKKLLVTLKK